jgi:IS5 family transposase
MIRYHKDSGVGLFSSDDRLSKLSALGDPLVALSSHIDFEFFRPFLVEVLHKNQDADRGGRPPFDPVLVFKILVLQRLYNLSDERAEFQINDRLSFMRFLGLDFAGKVPDAKTIWLFRDQLREKGLVEKLFEALNEELERRHIIVNEGQIVDASFVEAPRQRNSREENAAIKEGTIPAAFLKNKHRLSQKDTDARWAKKNEETHYGYKTHVMCDRKSKLVKKFQVTNAAVHDSTTLDDLLESGAADGQTLYADSAYRSAQTEASLTKRKITSRIHYKAARNRPLTAQQKISNKARSRKRARVEHIFGFMENAMGGMLVRAKSLTRNEAVIGLMTLTYNLCRVVQLGRQLRLSTA